MNVQTQWTRPTPQEPMHTPRHVLGQGICRKRPSPPSPESSNLKASMLLVKETAAKIKENLMGGSASVFMLQTVGYDVGEGGTGISNGGERDGAMCMDCQSGNKC